MRLINTSIFIMVSVLLILVSQAFGQEKRKVEVQCGEYKVAITCGRDNAPYSEDQRKCNKNTLTFTWPNGKVVTSKNPRHFDETKTPTEFACERGNDGQYYVVVTFLNGPNDCGPCTVIDLFKATGRRITANGKYLDKTTERLGISHRRTWISIEEEADR